MKAEYLPSPTSDLMLRRAILVYENTNAYDGGRPAAFATVHEVRNGVVQFGAPITPEFVEQLSAELVEHHRRQKKVDTSKLSPLIPENLIAIDSKMMAWFCPSAPRPIFFETNNEKLNKLSGTTVLHPSLLFIVIADRIRVFALAGTNKPDLDTRLFRAPYHNVYQDGALCRGSAAFPKGIHQGLIPRYEKAFFKSAFTHSNVAAERITGHPGGHLGLWKEMGRKKAIEFPRCHPFPETYLIPSKRTVRDVL